MPDFDYASRGPSRSGYPPAALIMAAYAPVVPELIPSGATDRMAMEVRRLFHDRLSQMRNIAQYAPLLDDTKYQYTRNCPPVCIQTDQQGRCCRHPLYCVFCHAREVVSPLWNVLKEACFFEGESRDDRWLIDFCYRRKFLFEKNYPPPMSVALKMITSEERYREIDWIDHQGAWVGHFIRPAEKFLIYERRGLIVTNREVWRDAPGKIQYNVMRGVTQPGMVAALSRACKFPREMWTCPVQYATSVLTQLAESKVKMRMMYGKFRSYAKT